MLIRFYKYDGVTPYTELKTGKVGGSQEDPILGNVERKLIVMCPNRKVGDIFNLRTNDGWSNPKFKITSEGKAKQVL